MNREGWGKVEAAPMIIMMIIISTIKANPIAARGDLVSPSSGHFLSMRQRE